MRKKTFLLARKEGRKKEKFFLSFLSSPLGTGGKNSRLHLTVDGTTTRRSCCRLELFGFGRTNWLRIQQRPPLTLFDPPPSPFHPAFLSFSPSAIICPMVNTRKAALLYSNARKQARPNGWASPIVIRLNKKTAAWHEPKTHSLTRRFWTRKRLFYDRMRNIDPFAQSSSKEPWKSHDLHDRFSLWTVLSIPA